MAADHGTLLRGSVSPCISVASPPGPRSAFASGCFSEKGTLALKTVGMVALGRLAGNLISRERNRPGDIPRKTSEDAIMIYLDAILEANSEFWEDGVEKYKGIAGASAGKQIYYDLIQLLEEKIDYINSRFAELT